LNTPEEYDSTIH